MRKINILLTAVLAILISIFITGFSLSTIENKTRLQKKLDNDNNRDNINNKAFCVEITKYYKSFPDIEIYGYVNHTDLSGDKDIDDYRLTQLDQINEQQRRLELFTKAGLLNEISSEHNHDTNVTTYAYKLTDEGNKYFTSTWRGTSFCFGRIVIDDIIETIPSKKSDPRGNDNVVKFTYHLENIPAWIQDEAIYRRYTNNVDLINLLLGKQMIGLNYYRGGNKSSWGYGVLTNGFCRNINDSKFC